MHRLRDCDEQLSNLLIASRQVAGLGILILRKRVELGVRSAQEIAFKIALAGPTAGALGSETGQVV